MPKARKRPGRPDRSERPQSAPRSFNEMADRFLDEPLPPDHRFFSVPLAVEATTAILEGVSLLAQGLGLLLQAAGGGPGAVVITLPAPTGTLPPGVPPATVPGGATLYAARSTAATGAVSCLCLVALSPPTVLANGDVVVGPITLICPKPQPFFDTIEVALQVPRIVIPAATATATGPATAAGPKHEARTYGAVTFVDGTLKRVSRWTKVRRNTGGAAIVIQWREGAGGGRICEVGV